VNAVSVSLKIVWDVLAPVNVPFDAFQVSLRDFHLQPELLQ